VVAAIFCAFMFLVEPFLEISRNSGILEFSRIAFIPNWGSFVQPPSMADVIHPIGMAFFFLDVKRQQPDAACLCKSS
jgi:hypothetical protein